MKAQAVELKARIEAEAGGSIADIRALAQGRDTRLHLIDLRDGRRLVVKSLLRPGDGNLEAEGWMLSYLRHNTELPVPRVISVGADRLIMSFVPEGGGIDSHATRDAADHLARLHNVEGLRFGLERDTAIGGLTQPNGVATDWVAFFRDNRLFYSARAAYDEGWIDRAMLGRLNRLGARLESLIDPPAAPSLIHGDVWAGNVMALNGRIAGFIDPAIYFADADVELAFISLFRTFDATFFDRYAERRAIRQGFTERKDIYNLYPLLVHVRLHGAGYIPAIDRILARFE